MRVSIAMATYNGGDYVKAQLDSFLCQTRLPDELVVNDDCSSDQTVAILHEYASRVPFEVHIKVNETNVGFVRNFDLAMSRATGDLIFLSDQDDVWLPEKIARMEAEMLARSDKACLVNDALLTDVNLVRSGLTKLGQIRAAGLPDFHFVMGCCVVVRRALLELALPIPSLPAHDSWLVQLADELGLCTRLSLPLQEYRRHEGNVSNFYVNNISPVNQSHVNRFSRAFSPGNLARQTSYAKNMLGRLTERSSSAISMVGPGTYAVTLDRLTKNLSVLEERVRIRCLPRMRRLMAVVALWRRGGYEEAGRFPGAIKDLVTSMPSCAASRGEEFQ